MAGQQGPIIALIGLGSIGISFAALHLKYSDALVRAYDPRPDLEVHVKAVLPVYLGPSFSESVDSLVASGGRLKLCSTLEEACTGASIVQEQGPENLKVKQSTWSRVLDVAPGSAHLWSSTSGILASRLVAGLEDKTRLLVIHPFNPPHIMPLIEIVPAQETHSDEVKFARRYFEQLNSGHRPVVVRKEVPGFVGNRLAFILFREACSLVANDVVDVKDLDTIVEASLGPRWAVAGPFKAYNYGGGTAGLPTFLKNLSETMEEIWQDAGTVTLRETEYDPRSTQLNRPAAASEGDGESNDDDDDGPTASWTQKIVQQTLEAYGFPDPPKLSARDAALQKVLQAMVP